MEKNLNTFKKAWANLIGMLIMGAGILFLSYILIQMSGTIGYIFLVAGILYELWVIKKMVALYNNYNEIKNNIAIIQSNYVKAKQELLEKGFVSNEHLSSFGYNFIEYRNCFNATDNMHIEIDYENKKIAYYMLLPYLFEIKEFNEIGKVELVTEKQIKNGRVFYTTIAVKINFADGKFFGLSVSDNMGCYENDNDYKKYMEDANIFIEKIEKLIKEQ